MDETVYVLINSILFMVVGPINGPNKLEFFIKLGWKGLPVINTLAYWAHLEVMNKMKSCEYNPGVFI